MKRAETHPCISDGLGLESVGHEDGGPWKLIVRKTGEFLAIVRFCPWCGKKLTEFDEMRTGKKAQKRSKR